MAATPAKLAHQTPHPQDQEQTCPAGEHTSLHRRKTEQIQSYQEHHPSKQSESAGQTDPEHGVSTRPYQALA